MDTCPLKTCRLHRWAVPSQHHVWCWSAVDTFCANRRENYLWVFIRILVVFYDRVQTLGVKKDQLSWTGLFLNIKSDVLNWPLTPTDAPGETKRDGSMFVGHHHHSTRGAVSEAVPLRRRLWDLRGSESRRGSTVKRGAVLVLGTPLQPNVLPPVSQLCWTVSTARARKQVGQNLLSFETN